ncbi:CGNR zinc finger domain-containing protein [Streptomyces bluensis]|uniref:CGNR zinc finger domain-containing protein n=1 Tax=Streptomyces bluensis TaxID=33897 RepID=A0ABW6UGF4_9ACTN
MASGTATASYEPRFDCGRLCLDLLATTHPEEQLHSVERLRAWIAGAGCVPPGTQLVGADVSWLVDFRELRDRIGQTVHREPGPDPRSVEVALARINAFARAATPAPRVVRTADGTLVRSLDGAPGRAALLAVVARDAVELLTDPAACASLRQCAGDNCPIVYVDTSRGRRRRWCSSETCGNRERVARHRRRAALARA